MTEVSVDILKNVSCHLCKHILLTYLKQKIKIPLKLHNCLSVSLNSGHNMKACWWHVKIWELSNIRACSWLQHVTSLWEWLFLLFGHTQWQDIPGHVVACSFRIKKKPKKNNVTQKAVVITMESLMKDQAEEREHPSFKPLFLTIPFIFSNKWAPDQKNTSFKCLMFSSFLWRLVSSPLWSVHLSFQESIIVTLFLLESQSICWID